MRLVDSHCHLDVAAFDADRAAVLARSRAAGVDRLLLPAITAAGWKQLEQLCATEPGLFPALGLHPLFLDVHQSDDLDRLRRRIERQRPQAIGECGLDFHSPELDRDWQMTLFEAQLALAVEYDLPVIVHARKAVEAVLQAIRRHPGVRGVVHSYGGSPEQAAQLWQLGFCLGLGGPLTYPGAHRLHRLVQAMPLEQLLLETDAPDQPDAGIRGQRNEPARLPEVLRAVARLRTEPIEHIAAQTCANAVRLFRLPD